jgi:hypothetical protein
VSSSGPRGRSRAPLAWLAVAVLLALFAVRIWYTFFLS